VLVRASFERALSADIRLAFFVPGIVYLADAIGTQTEAIVVRGLSVSHLPLRRLLGSELRTGLLMGIVLATLSVPAVALGTGDLRLALAVALAIVVAGGFATTIGLLLPWLLSRHGRDPAFGSGPLATIVQDVLSLVVYFATVSLLFR
jgi:magnesium transporter